LKDDRRLDVAASDVRREKGLSKRGTDRAASSAALAVEDDVTFYSIQFKRYDKIDFSLTIACSVGNLIHDVAGG
jgi:hypothetical protein